jgi:hypothetical protein
MAIDAGIFSGTTRAELQCGGAHSSTPRACRAGLASTGRHGPSAPLPWPTRSRASGTVTGRSDERRSPLAAHHPGAVRWLPTRPRPRATPARPRWAHLEQLGRAGHPGPQSANGVTPKPDRGNIETTAGSINGAAGRSGTLENAGVFSKNALIDQAIPPVWRSATRAS